MPDSPADNDHDLSVALARITMDCHTCGRAMMRTGTTDEVLAALEEFIDSHDAVCLFAFRGER